MKTILSRLKTLVQHEMVEGGTLSYVKSVEIVHPELLEVHSNAVIPKIVFTPSSTSESWVASQKKEATNTVLAYLVLRYAQRETSIMGDATRAGGHGKGIMDFVSDFLSVVRGHRLSVDGTIYLDKPLDISTINYIREDLGENAHLLVAEITMQCTYQFLQTDLPGNI